MKKQLSTITVISLILSILLSSCNTPTNTVNEKLPSSYYIQEGKNYVLKTHIEFEFGERLAKFETGIWGVMTEIAPISQQSAYPMYNGMDKFYLGQVLLPDQVHFDTLVVIDPELLTLKLALSHSMNDLEIMRAIYSCSTKYSVYNF